MHTTVKDGQYLENEIHKEIHKLKYFLGKADKLIRIKDYTKMEIAKRRAGKS